MSAGLIMMMAQTSLITALNAEPDCSPARALEVVNGALRENVGRLGSHHYMTMSILKLGDQSIEVAGHHQDIIIYRAAEGAVEVVPTNGTWLGIADSLEGFVTPSHIRVEAEDVILLFTDGLTEATGASGEMFGQDRLVRLFAEHARSEPADAAKAMLDHLHAYQHDQHDDMTLLVVRKVDKAAVAEGPTSGHGANPSAS
ncbi:MAG: serine/threonine-protein phosphatase [Ectothiorhodospiraceae bacterium]|nr:serine/threonine-protein phosphatase [Ectothiorhodospiraceae bacterium]